MNQTESTFQGAKRRPTGLARREPNAIGIVMAVLAFAATIVFIGAGAAQGGDDSTPPVDPKWGNALMTVSPKVVEPGGVITFTLVGESQNSRAGLLGGVGWGRSIAGTVVSGCTNFDMTCSFRVGTARPTYWYWNLASASLPNNYFQRTEGCDTTPEFSCASFVTTYGWSYWAIRPSDGNRPSASFTVAREVGTAAGTYRFTSTTKPVNGFTPTLNWDFGDGSTNQGPTTVIHTYAKPGDFTAKLTATIGGESDTASQPVSVDAPGLSVSISLTDAGRDGPTIGIVPKEKNTPNRSIRITVGADDGVGDVTGISFVDGLASLTPPGLVEIVSMPSPAPFTLSPSETRSFDIDVIGRTTGILSVDAAVRGKNKNGTVSGSRSTRIGVGGDGVLDAQLTVTPDEIKLEEDNEGVAKPVKLKVQLLVSNTGTVPLTNLQTLAKPDVEVQNPQDAPTDWDKVVVYDPKGPKQDLVTSVPLAPGETRTAFWTFEIRNDTPLRFRQSVSADNPNVPGQTLRALPTANAGPKRQKLLRLEIAKARGAGTGPIIADDARTYNVTFTNLSSKVKLRVGPTAFLKVFGPVLAAGPEPYTKDIDAPGIWSDDDLGPGEKDELRVQVRTSDDGSKTLDTFKLRLYSSIEVFQDDGTWRPIDPKEMILKPGTPQIADSVQNTYDPAASIDGAAIGGLETLGGFVGKMAMNGLFFVYDIEQNPSKYSSAVVVGGKRLTTSAQIYSRYLMPANLSVWWLAASPNGREKILFDLYQQMEADSKDTFKVLKLGYDVVAAPIGDAMTEMAVSYENGNYTAFQDATLRLTATMATDGVTGEGAAAITKLGAKEVRKLFGKRILEKATNDIADPSFAAKAEQVVEEGVNMPAESRCVATKGGEIPYGTEFTKAEMVRAAAVDILESGGLLRIADEEGISITIRDRDPNSIRLLEDRISTLKPESIKAKGISDIDEEFFGAPTTLRGQTAIFEPPPWAEVEAKMASKGIKPESEKGLKILERYGDRKLELSDPDFLPQYEKWQKEGGFTIGFDGGGNRLPDANFVRERKFQLGSGGTTNGGKRIYIPQTLSNDGSWLSFTGDIDGVSILNADGSLITDPDKAFRVYRKLGEAIGDLSVYDVIGIPHGETATCTAKGADKLKDRYLWGVRDSFQYAPDGKIRLVRPVEELSGDGFIHMRGGYYGGKPAWTNVSKATLESNLAKLNEKVAALEKANLVNDLDKLKKLKGVDPRYVNSVKEALARFVP